MSVYFVWYVWDQGHFLFNKGKKDIIKGKKDTASCYVGPIYTILTLGMC